jgi:hypothetical protein
MKKIPAKHGATHSGFHFIEEFKNCKRHWYIGNLIGFQPEKKPFMLLFGGAFHAGKAAFYKKRDIEAGVRTFKAELKSSRPQMEEPEKFYPFLLERGPLMLRRWADTHGYNDLSNYKVLAVEKILEVRLPNGYLLTVKPDAVLQASNGNIYIFETKTSFFSANLQEDVVALGDQATTYLYAWGKATGKTAAGVVPDIIYWNRNSRKSEDIEIRRGSLITRSKRELLEFQDGVMSDLMDMSARVRGLAKTNAASMFPRTTSHCIAYNRRCEYADICREDVKDIKYPPGGFIRETFPGKTKLKNIGR